MAWSISLTNLKDTFHKNRGRGCSHGRWLHISLQKSWVLCLICLRTLSFSNSDEIPQSEESDRSVQEINLRVIIRLASVKIASEVESKSGEGRVVMQKQTQGQRGTEILFIALLLPLLSVASSHSEDEKDESHEWNAGTRGELTINPSFTQVHLIWGLKTGQSSNKARARPRPRCRRHCPFSVTRLVVPRGLKDLDAQLQKGNDLDWSPAISLKKQDKKDPKGSN